MKKKVNVFGKSIPVLAIFVLGIALVSAALVPYLSGLVTGTTNVDSPVVLMGADGDSDKTVTWTEEDQLPDDELFSEGVGSLDLTATAYGGHSEGFWIKMENQADRTFFDAERLYLVFEITETSGLGMSENPTGEIGDLDAQITIYDWDSGSKLMRGPFDAEEILPITKVGSDEKTWRIYTDMEFFAADSDGDDIYAYVNMDFELNALGTYEIKASVFGNDKLADIQAGNALRFPIA